jgi:hypothetical protein
MNVSDIVIGATYGVNSRGSIRPATVIGIKRPGEGQYQARVDVRIEGELAARTVASRSILRMPPELAAAPASNGNGSKPPEPAGDAPPAAERDVELAIRWVVPLSELAALFEHAKRTGGTIEEVGLC